MKIFEYLLAQLFIIYVRVSVGERFSFNDCHRIFPSSSGTWIDYPPFWLPNCTSNEIHVFGPASIEKCLKGKTIYVIGNSIARGVLFELLEMLGGASVSREDQKGQCTKLNTVWEDSCHKELAGVKVKFLFLQYMDGWDYSGRYSLLFFAEFD